MRSADLLQIPGVGPSIAADLQSLGIGEVAQLRGCDAEQLYARLCEEKGHKVDRCVLYVFRCAVYFAGEPKPDAELLKWWNWKDAGDRNQEEISAGALVARPLTEPAS